jgi:hypothetical protein
MKTVTGHEQSVASGWFRVPASAFRRHLAGELQVSRGTTERYSEARAVDQLLVGLAFVINFAKLQ